MNSVFNVKLTSTSISASKCKHVHVSKKKDDDRRVKSRYYNKDFWRDWCS